MGDVAEVTGPAAVEIDENAPKSISFLLLLLLSMRLRIREY